MSHMLSHYANSRDNNFNLLRFVAATLVLVSHSFALAIGTGDVEPLRDTIGMSWGNIAVDVFFITSGFLIAGSFYARNNLIAFVWARLLRIYPGCFVAVLFCTLVVGAIYTELPLANFLTEAETWLFTIKNATLIFGIEYRLPGVFESNPYQFAVNGSLWTLPYELKMYILLALLAVLLNRYKERLGDRFVKLFFPLAAIFALTIHILIEFGVIGFPGFLYRLFTPKFIQLFSMFFIGTSFYIWRHSIPLSHSVAGIFSVLLLAATINHDLFLVVYTIVLPYLVFYLAYLPKGFVRKFNQYGDYSYGIYIYAFPVQQALAASFVGIDVITMIWASFLGTFLLSYLSWHFVEKQCLSMKDKYIVIQEKLQRFSRS